MGIARQLLRGGLEAFAGGRVVSRLPASTTDAAGLTFDDGPHPEFTPKIIDILAGAGARATFFMNGVCCREHPALVERVLDEGHDVATHGYSHYAPSEVSSRAYVADVEAGHAALEAIAGCPLPRRFRPPYGAVSLATLATLLRRGYRYVLWSLDSGDSSGGTVDAVVDAVRAARAGDVVLLHDDYATTVAALPRILDDLRTRGLGTATLDGRVSEARPHRPVGPRAVRQERCA